MLKPQGIIPALVTPFDDDEQLNISALEEMAERLINAGVHGLFCLGTNGEFFSLTFEEKVRATEAIVEQTKGRVPVYAGAGCISTQETIQLAKRLEQAGADALSIITPYFLTFSQKELEDHYRRIADSTSLPIVLYTIPGRTGNTLTPAVVSRLASVENIVGIKDSSGSYDTILQYIESVPDGFSVLAGTDSLILATLMAGGKGAIASTANALPKTVVSIYECWKEGDYELASRAQKALQPLRNIFSKGTLPSVLKQYLNKLGVPAGMTRNPVHPVSQEVEQELSKLLEEYQQQGYE